MDYNVKTLLEKYWEGESSLEEERQLRTYFQQKEIAPELEQYRSLFSYFEAQQSISMSGDIKAGRFEMELEPKKKPTIIQNLWRVAAAVALVVGSYSIYNNVIAEENKSIVWEDTFETEEEALAKAKEVLLLVSRKMKKGTDKAATSLGKMEVATGVIRE